MNGLFAPWFDNRARVVLILAGTFSIWACDQVSYFSFPMAWAIYGGQNTYIYIAITGASGLLFTILFCVAAGTKLLEAIGVGLSGAGAHVVMLHVGNLRLGELAILPMGAVTLVASTATIWILGHHRK